MIMRTKLLIITGYFILLFDIASAQDTNNLVKQKPSFQSINLIGILEGENGSAFQLHTINGFAYKSWYTGLGVGLDYYQERAIPFYLDIRKSFSDKKKSAFVYGDAGVQFPWLNKNDKQVDYKYKAGFMYEMGLGYHLPLGTNMQLQLSAGYSYKSYKQEHYYDIWIWDFPVTQKDIYDYNLRRVSIKAGISF
jgi:hypothetical protein